MTFLEKLERDGKYPNIARDIRNGLALSCPSDYGYEEFYWCDSSVDCRDCWNREVTDGE